ncbi:MAG: M28 family peptidase [Candidatus Poseidoniaceae archaeon]|nr:M28 family peptidase [Candidatus Poseidoniaceae archaeon]
MLLPSRTQSGSKKHLIGVVFACFLLVNVVSVSGNTDDPDWADSVDFCQKTTELQFNGTLANHSVVWQTELGPRLPGSNASSLLRTSLSENLTSFGWNVEFSSHISHEIELTNVIATWKPQNLSQNETDKLGRIVLSAHYDSRNIADRDSNESLRNTPILGANDGASGVAALIELGRIIPNMNLSNEVMLLFSDAEDQGDNYTLGAKAWADNLTGDEINRTESFILLDMIGDSDLHLTNIIPSTPILTQNMMLLGQKLGLSNQTDGCNGQRSDVMWSNQSLNVIDDHVHAYYLGIPSLDIIDLAYGENASPFEGYWHTTQDTADKVSAESLQSVGRIVELGLLTGAWTTIDTPLEVLEKSTNPNDSEELLVIDEDLDAGADSSTLLAIISSSVIALSIVSLIFLNRFVD